MDMPVVIAVPILLGILVAMVLAELGSRKTADPKQPRVTRLAPSDLLARISRQNARGELSGCDEKDGSLSHRDGDLEDRQKR